MRSYDEAAWQKIREQGKTPFLLKNGLVGRGLPMGAIVAVAITALKGGVFPDAFRTLEFYQLLAFTIAVFTASGCVAAYASWSLHEKKYTQAS